MHKSWQNILRSVDLKGFFSSLGLETVYDFLREKIIMNNMTFMVLCAFLFLMVFCGFQFDNPILKWVSILILVFILFFRMAMLL